jgi:DnaJ family protein A protein 5
MRVTTADDIARMMGKFRANVDFSDSPNGFYGFIRETFEQLASEEGHAANYEGVNIPDYPSFGHKADTHDGVVRDFYAIWNGFATVKTFAWMDVYRTADAGDRRMRRLMEKENRKFREEGIRAFNDAVRTLVSFVRKRDPRYTPNVLSPEEAAKAQREANRARAAKARAANAAKMQQEQDEAVPDWTKARDSDEVDEESEEEVEENIFECVACHKTFKSERQYDAHEKSKKHQKAVYALKKKMQKDNAHLSLDEDIPDSNTMTPVSADGEIEKAGISEADAAEDSIKDLASDVDDIAIEDDKPDDEIPLTSDDEVLADSNAKPSQDPAPISSPEDEDENNDNDNDEYDEYDTRSDIEARLANYRKPSNAPDIQNASPLLPSDPSPTAAPDPTPAGKKLGAAAKKRAKKAAKQNADEDATAPDSKHKCAMCKAGFSSKTQLFQHITDFGHAAPVGVTKGGAATGKKGKRK